MNRTRFPIVGILLAALGCKAPAYVTVSVESSVATPLFQLDLTADDGAHTQSAYAPASPGNTALTFPQSYVITAPTNAAFVRADVDGFDAFGNIVARGSSELQPLATGGFSQNLTVTLTTACASQRDCDPNPTCAGFVTCAFADGDPDGGADAGAGRCIAADAGAALPAGTACGPAGVCDAGVCLGAFCGDGVLQTDAGEQCDDGDLNSDVEPFACRTDCETYHCGDGVVDQGPNVDGGIFGERCDLGVANGLGQGCNSTCSLIGATSLLAGFQDQPGWYDAETFDNGGGTLFYRPAGLAAFYPFLYVADYSNSAIRTIHLDAGEVYTVAGSPSAAPKTQDGFGSDAGFYLPSAVSHVALGELLVGEAGAVRQVDLTTQQVTTLAGAGCSGLTFNTCTGNTAGSYDAGASAVTFTSLTGFAYDPFADILYATEPQLGTAGIRALSLPSSTAAVVPLADGPQSPAGIAILDGGALYVLDDQDNLLWQLDLDAGTAVNISAELTPLPGLAAAGIQFMGFNGAEGLCTDGTSVFIPDTGNSTVWQFDPATLSLSLLAGAGSTSFATTVYGTGVGARFEGPLGCDFDPVTGSLFVSDGTAEVIFQIQ